MLREISKKQSARTAPDNNLDWLAEDLEAIGIYLRLDGSHELAEAVEGLAEQAAGEDDPEPIEERCDNCGERLDYQFGLGYIKHSH